MTEQMSVHFVSRRWIGPSNAPRRVGKGGSQMQGVKKVGGTKSTKAKETIVMGEVKALQLFHRMMQLAYLGVSALPILPSQTVCGVERGSVMLYALCFQPQTTGPRWATDSRRSNPRCQGHITWTITFKKMTGDNHISSHRSRKPRGRDKGCPLGVEENKMAITWSCSYLSRGNHKKCLGKRELQI